MSTRIIVTDIAVLVAKGRQRDAFKLLHDTLENAKKEAEPSLKEAEEEIVKLVKALAYYYRPTSSEWEYWQKHCDEIWAAGGSPPDETEWLVNLALSKVPEK